MDDIFRPVMESSVVLAAHYAKACGRDAITADDIMIGLMYAGRYVTGKQIGSAFPEIYEGSSSDEEEEEDEDEEEDAFTRYDGTDNEMAIKMNNCFDEWDAWEPETPAEFVIKAAVNKTRQETSK
jgi:hypothetical protein